MLKLRSNVDQAVVSAEWSSNLEPAALQRRAARNVFRELSSGLVMVGYIMTLLQFVLSGRFEWLSGRIGIDRTMRFHQVASWVFFDPILVHPLLYVIPILPSGLMEALAALNRMFSSRACLVA